MRLAASARVTHLCLLVLELHGAAGTANSEHRLFLECLSDALASGFAYEYAINLAKQGDTIEERTHTLASTSQTWNPALRTTRSEIMVGGERTDLEEGEIVDESDSDQEGGADRDIEADKWYSQASKEEIEEGEDAPSKRDLYSRAYSTYWGSRLEGMHDAYIEDADLNNLKDVLTNIVFHGTHTPFTPNGHTKPLNVARTVCSYFGTVADRYVSFIADTRHVQPRVAGFNSAQFAGCAPWTSARIQVLCSTSAEHHMLGLRTSSYAHA